jgi:hypothetical protein
VNWLELAARIESVDELPFRSADRLLLTIIILEELLPQVIH